MHIRPFAGLFVLFALSVGCSSDDASKSNDNDGGDGGASSTGGAKGSGGSGDGGASGSGGASPSSGGMSGSGGASGTGGASPDDGGVDGAPEGGDAGNPSLAAPPSNIPLDEIDSENFYNAGDCTIAEPECVIDTDEGTISCLSDSPAPFGYAQVMQAEGGVQAGVFACKNFRIEAAASLRVQGTLPLVIVAWDTVQIVGELTADAEMGEAMGGGFSSEPENNKGGGPGGGAPAAKDPDGGGGGGGYCGNGGDGGLDATLAAGGTPFGTEAIVPLLGGSAGGSGRFEGGAGGGAIQISAGTSITVNLTGIISAGGGGGKSSSSGGSGGGSGGAILLEAPDVTVSGTLAVNGGGGTGFQGGQDGGNARSDATPAPGGGDTGGDGSAGETLDGAPSTNIESGGGGGAGRIRINTASGEASITGTLSPGVDTLCVTQGTLE